MDLLPCRPGFWDSEFFEGHQETELVGPLGVSRARQGQWMHVCPRQCDECLAALRVCWFQSGKLVTKMFQKIQDLIDDKDALVFVLIDEVGVSTCGVGIPAASALTATRPLSARAALHGTPHVELAQAGSCTPTHLFIHSLSGCVSWLPCGARHGHF